jgi:hypothetical protein
MEQWKKRIQQMALAMEWISWLCCRLKEWSEKVLQILTNSFVNV